MLVTVTVVLGVDIGYVVPIAHLLEDLKSPVVLPACLLVVSLGLGQHAKSSRKHCCPVGVSWDPGEHLLTELLCLTVGPAHLELLAYPVSDCKDLIEFDSSIVVIAGFQ
jgi:hypothetical protein